MSQNLESESGALATPPTVHGIARMKKIEVVVVATELVCIRSHYFPNL